MGGLACFFGTRRFGQAWVRRRWHGQPLLRGIERAVSKRGFPMLVAIRLAPWPFALTTCALAIIPTLRVRDFVAATAVGLLKAFWHVYVGSSLEDFTGGSGNSGGNSTGNGTGNGTGNSGNNSSASRTLITLAVSTLLLLASTYFIVRAVQREMHDAEWVRLDTTGDRDDEADTGDVGDVERGRRSDGDVFVPLDLRDLAAYPAAADKARLLDDGI